MINLLVKSGKLVGTAVVALGAMMAVMMGSSSLWSQFQSSQTAQFRNQFAFLLSSKTDFQQIAQNNNQSSLDSSIKVDWKSVFQSPKVAAITLGESDHSGLVVRRTLGEIDPLMKSLDASWIPRTVDEVNLVVGLRWGKQLVGRYSAGSNAYRETCQFAVFERSTGLLILEGTAVGSPPRSSNKGSSGADIYGGFADADVVKLIKGEIKKLANAT